jgi:Protein of unknown function (DUF3078)
MNKILLSICLLIGIISTTFGQVADSTSVDSTAIAARLLPLDTVFTKPDSLIFWKTSGSLNVNLQQIALKNWAAGGNSSIAFGGAVEGSANYSKNGKIWENNVKVGYGMIRNGGEGNNFEKTDDFVIVGSKYGQKFSEKVMMTTAVYFRTQMDEGYKDQKNASGEIERVFISDFMAPGYLQASVGLTLSKSESIFATLSPFTGRFTFVLNDSLSNAGAFGVNPGDYIRSEAGISLMGKFEKEIFQNVKMQVNGNLFANYETFPNTVVNVEMIINMKVNNFISSNISSHLIYDDKVTSVREDGSVGTDVQIKNIINLGFTLGF